MMEAYVCTVIAPLQLPHAAAQALSYLKSAGIFPEREEILSENRAIDLYLAAPVPRTVMDTVRNDIGADILCQRVATRKKALFFADMDATMVAEETLDELAAYAGIKQQIAAITTRAMNGELDFKDALRERIALLKGLPLSALEKTAAAVTYTKDAKTLIATLKKAGIHCVLVSGGFTYFTGKVGDYLGFDENHGNVFGIDGDALSGTVVDPILDKNFKLACLKETASRLGVTLDAAVAIGDGANDQPMLEGAGLGVGFYSKPVLRAALDNHILHNGMDALLYALGFREADIIRS